MRNDVKLVCLYGPESVGKTTLAKRLAAHYKTIFVPEVARDLITSNDLTPDDYVRIGHAQTEAVVAAIPQANRVLICDTDVITTQLYAEIYLGKAPEILDELQQRLIYDLYFLLDIDVPWIADGLRDLGHRREEIFLKFKEGLTERQIPYILISGNWEERWTTVTTQIDQLLVDVSN
ncbi:AAA family ATPase [Tellurirhabdus bombi]|uniref:AAA family ATPase n=1 Tax=Tellurirhabdus bombi TaxID=2907205 RepID=UPI001F48BE30|nr:ATP-binding protein [Tellurirhabdus bombi]